MFSIFFVKHAIKILFKAQGTVGMVLHGGLLVQSGDHNEGKWGKICRSAKVCYFRVVGDVGVEWN